MSESRAQQIARWERAGMLDPTCVTCIHRFYWSDKMPAEVHEPNHAASHGCESGKRPHCTCDRCW